MNTNLLIKLSEKREFKLGTTYVDENNRFWKYAKIDFGVAGKVENKTYHNIKYGWVRWR